jgi:hypothetical protein
MLDCDDHVIRVRVNEYIFIVDLQNACGCYIRVRARRSDLIAAWIDYNDPAKHCR